MTPVFNHTEMLPSVRGGILLCPRPAGRARQPDAGPSSEPSSVSLGVTGSGPARLCVQELRRSYRTQGGDRAVGRGPRARVHAGAAEYGMEPVFARLLQHVYPESRELLAG